MAKSTTTHYVSRWATIQMSLPEDVQFLPGIAVQGHSVVLASVGTLDGASSIWEVRVAVGPVTVADGETVIGWAMDDLTILTLIARRLT